MKYCGKCGAEVEETAQFCHSCGAAMNGYIAPAEEVKKPKKKKRGCLVGIVCVLLALLLLVIIIVGSAGESEVKEPVSVNAAVTENTEKESAPEEALETAPIGTEVFIEEVEIYSMNGLVVTAKRLEETLLGTEIVVTINNNSDRNVVISTRDLSVNSFMMAASGMWCDVAAGKSANTTITIHSSELREAGIETVADIEFALHIYDSDSFEDIDNSGLIKISTSAPEDFVQAVDDSGDEIYNSDGVRVVCKGLLDDWLWEGSLVFFLENSSGRNISIHSENVSVNGFMEDVGFWVDMRPDTMAVSDMFFLDLSDLELESVDDIENIEFSFRIIDADTWEEIGTSDVIVLDF